MINQQIILRASTEVLDYPHSQLKSLLLKWVNTKIPYYNITNFSSDWYSGKAISALADAVFPEILKPPTKFTNDPVEDARLGISKAERFGIPALVQPEELRTIDERSMMMYMLCFRNNNN